VVIGEGECEQGVVQLKALRGGGESGTQDLQLSPADLLARFAGGMP
jgi:hypothetical protein